MRMAPRKKASKEEILQKKRDAERKRYQEMKNDPQKREELRAKEQLKYLRKKERGTRKLVNNMTRREHRVAKEKWKEHCTKYRHRKKSDLQEVTSQSEKLRRIELPDSVDVGDFWLNSTDHMLGTEEENEFDLFCRSLAVQLKRMPLERALRCQEKLQAVMSAERLAQQLGSRTHTTEAHTETALIDYLKIEPEEIL